MCDRTNILGIAKRLNNSFVETRTKLQTIIQSEKGRSVTNMCSMSYCYVHLNRSS